MASSAGLSNEAIKIMLERITAQLLTTLKNAAFKFVCIVQFNDHAPCVNKG